MPPSISHRSEPIYFVCALADEARQFVTAIEALNKQTHGESRRPMKVVQTGLGAKQIIETLSTSCLHPPGAIVIAGTAGGLNSSYAPGDTVVFSSVADSSGRCLSVSDHWVETLTVALADLQPKIGIGYTSDDAVSSIAQKSSLYSKFHVDCVDMETATIIRFADEHAIPVAAFRVVVDPHNQSIPAAALAGLKSDGTTDVLATIFSLFKGPRQLPELLRLASQYRQSMRTLARAAWLLTSHFAECSTLGEHC